jgi:hypothetical protein
MGEVLRSAAAVATFCDQLVPAQSQRFKLKHMHAYSTLLYIQTLLELGDHGGTWLQIRKVQQA